jgi:hypothetical protein
MEIEIPTDLNRDGKRAVEQLHIALGDHDPRAALLREARLRDEQARADRSDRSGKVGAT